MGVNSEWPHFRSRGLGIADDRGEVRTSSLRDVDRTLSTTRNLTPK
ncbi:hypothetical protein OHB54_02000 [Streptomyces sp. NBC_01007]|nr:hypothetical protein OHB54_02000 [Streptomyces sp. NBC_01007]